MRETETAQPADRGLVTETIAVLGAGGTMGFPIARNIARAGLPVRVWNRSRGKAAPLAADGAYLARSPRDAATGAGIAVTMLADEDAVIAAMDGPDGALRTLSGRTLSGRTLSGPEQARHRLAPLFDAIGQRTIRAGEAGAGSRLKTVVDCWVLAVVEAGAEMIALAEALDLRRAAGERDLDLPLIEALARRYAEAAKEHGDKDFSATYRLSAPNPD
jgi:3-hydroxyisobutyrate dehydrogenase